MVSSVDGKTSIVGLVGCPVSHSFSPFIHNTLFQEYGLNFIYVPFSVEPKDLQTAVKGLVSISVKGFNVTIPHKEKIISFVDKVDVTAQKVGAINTVYIEDKKTYGYNTDVSGFMSSLKEAGFEIKGKKIAVLGAGGSARAVVAAAALEEAFAVFIANRTYTKAEKLAYDFQNDFHGQTKALSLDDNLEDIYNSHVIINTTSLGMTGMSDSSPVSEEVLHKDHLVVDIIYNPPETLFLKKARQKGCKGINGMGMLVYQALHSFEIWTGKKPSGELVYSLLTK